MILLPLGFDILCFVHNLRMAQMLENKLKGRPLDHGVKNPIPDPRKSRPKKKKYVTVITHQTRPVDHFEEVDFTHQTRPPKKFVGLEEKQAKIVFSNGKT